tara:strand:+ start:317 stop:847 length:531 start_codon:yes stop_codon:yes gene_type:complete
MSVSSIVNVGIWNKPTNIRLNTSNFVKNKHTKLTILWDYTNPPVNMNVYWELQINNHTEVVLTPSYTFIPFGTDNFTTVKIRSVYRYNVDTTHIKSTNLGISEWSEEIKIPNNKDNYCIKDCNIINNITNNNGNSNNTLITNNKNISSKFSYANSVQNKRKTSSHNSNYKPCLKLN